MLLSNTPYVYGKKVVENKGIVSADIFMGANFMKDFLAGITDTLGGRSGSYERTIHGGREKALKQMVKQAKKIGANAIVGVDFVIQTGGKNNTMLLVSATGTAITYQD